MHSNTMASTRQLTLFSSKKPQFSMMKHIFRARYKTILSKFTTSNQCWDILNCHPIANYSIQSSVNHLPCILVTFINSWISGKLSQGVCCSCKRYSVWQTVCGITKAGKKCSGSRFHTAGATDCIWMVWGHGIGQWWGWQCGIWFWLDWCLWFQGFNKERHKGFDAACSPFLFVVGITGCVCPQKQA